jgi:monofunctional biosynthetic peptidoglycan transglycosylase
VRRRIARGIPPVRRQAIFRRRPSPWRRLRRLLWLPAGFVLVTVLQVATVRFVDPWTSAYMLARRVEAWSAGETLRIDYRWRDWDALSPHLPIALVAAEDQKFPTHRGFDFDAIDAALARYQGDGRLRGASTISQQVARNLYLWSGRSWLRKGLEAWYTVLIEALWPKRRILEIYVNVAEFGDGIYGAEAAAQRFFGKPASALTAAESARLAAVLPNPRRFRADAPSPYVLRRQHWIEQQLRQLGGPEYLRECCG